MKVLLSILVLATGALGASPDQIAGVWLTPNGLSKVEISKCGERWCGAIRWMQTPRNDEHNEDSAQRSRSLVGAQILTGFTFDGGSGWTGGKIYAPERGRTVDAKLVLVNPDLLEVRVSAGIVKKTVSWTRVRQ